MKSTNSLNFTTRIFAVSIPIIVVLLSIFTISNCSKKSTEPNGIVYPDSNLSFYNHIQPIFMRNCVLGCHETFNPASGLDLETPAPTFNSDHGSVIIPFESEQSRLYILLLGPNFGMRQMPRERTPLQSNEITAIKNWIDKDGAVID